MTDRDSRDVVVSSGESIVRDLVTGLVWQGCAAGQTSAECTGSGTESNWAEALSYCEALTLHELSDWRLPSYFELQSLVNYGSTVALDDLATFPNAPRFSFWTASTSAVNPANAWEVHFGSGRSAEANKASFRRFYTRCVRGTPSSLEGSRFVRGGTAEEPIVDDTATGLVWQGCASGQEGDSCEVGSATGVNWGEALYICEALTSGGHTDWRLPNVSELASIVDLSRSAPAIARNAFPETASSLFWTSTSSAGTDNSAWSVSFDRGVFDTSSKRNNHDVRCVRGEPRTL